MEAHYKAIEIIDALGGCNNISAIEYCMTRVRATVFSSDTVEDQRIRDIQGVYGLYGRGNVMQIILGPGDAQEICEEMKRYLKNESAKPI